jgi:osmotically-inducible protein OsmY
VIADLYRYIFGIEPVARALDQIHIPENGPRRAIEPYLAARVRDAILKDPTTGELDVQVSVEGNNILLRGEVRSVEHKNATERVAAATAPGYNIVSHLRVAELTEPEGTEAVG